MTIERRIILLEEQMRLMHQVLLGHQVALTSQQEEIARLKELIEGIYNFKGRTQ